MYTLDSVITLILQDRFLWVFSILICLIFFFIWKFVFGFKTSTKKFAFICLTLILFFLMPFITMGIIHEVFWKSKSVSCVMLQTTFNSEEKCTQRKDCTLSAFPAPGNGARACLPLLESSTLPQTPETYTACGCGCCGGTTPREECLYHSKGDDLNEIIQSDKDLQSSSACSVMGCSSGVHYRYCD